MPDNRYYYFKDAKGNRHTVNKAAFDNDREGFAKAFPGARMEVIDRKTGRRGDVDVKDAGRVGDFGAHLFTGQTVKREKYQPKTSLGKAAQSVAQEKWGGKESELVKGLREADALKRRDEEQMPIDYTKPGAVKQMVKQTRERQHVVGQNVEQAGRQFTNRERDRRNAPAFDLGNEDVNNSLVKTRGQLEDEVEKSANNIVAQSNGIGGMLDNTIGDVFGKVDKEAIDAFRNTQAGGFDDLGSSALANLYKRIDPEKVFKELNTNVEKNISQWLTNPSVISQIDNAINESGISKEAYVNNILVPQIMKRMNEKFDQTELSRNMDKGMAQYYLNGLGSNLTGTLMDILLKTKGTREYEACASAMTEEGLNPDVNPNMADRVIRQTVGFFGDTSVFGPLGKAGAAVTGKIFGNGVAQTARIANSTLGGRIARMAGSGMVSQGITGVLYGSTNAAVQNYSTGDDTSIGNTVKLMAMGGLSEGASWATMGGIGGAVGAGIYNVSGVKRIPAKAFQLAMEGIGMHMGGNVAKTIEGHDTDWLSVEGNLEACANVVALKLTHARLPKRQEKDGVKESYLDVVARNIKSLMTSDGQRAAFGGYTFTNEEKEQLFGSASAPKRNESIYGYDVHDNPLTRKESLTSWAMRAKKTAAKGKGEKDTDAEFVKTAYDEIMADNTIPWDTKAKFSALVMGTVPSERPMMENCRIEGDSVNEYSKNGELLSKNSFKSIDERNSIIYSLNLKREDQRLSNAYGAAQIKDEKTAQTTLEAVAEANGMTAEQLKTAMDKQPLRRSEEEQNACVALRKAYEDEQFVPGTLHAEQSNTEGKDVVEENGLGTETPNNEAVAEVLGDLTKAEDALQTAMDGNDVLKEEYERMQKAGMSNPQIYMELFNSGLTQEQLAPLADYINALSKAQGMFKGTQDKIVETTQKHVGQWSYKDELNGEKQNGEQMLFVKDNKGRVLIVGAGDVAFDNEGRARESVGDMLSVLDPATMEMDFVSKKDVQLDHTEKTEDYAKNYQTMLEVKNSEVYAQNEQQKQMEKKPENLPKGRKQVVRSLSLLDKVSSPKDKLNEIRRIEQNVELGEKGAITPEEQAHVDEVLAELKEQGYEMDNEGIVGSEFRNNGRNDIIVDNASVIEPGDPRYDKLEDGQTVIDKIIKPKILKDGKIYQPATVTIMFRADTSVSERLYEAKRELAGMLKADESNEIVQRKIAETKAEIAELEKKKAEELASKPQQNPTNAGYEIAKTLKEKIGGSLSEEEATNLVGEMESRAEEAHDMPLTPENWEAEFGEDGKVQTPLGEVKMGKNQLVKLFERGRSKEFGMIKPTLSDPDVVIEVPSEAKDGKAERDTSLLFIKTFKKPNGEKVYYFKSVTIKKDGIEISISSHYDRRKRVEEALKNGKLLYLKQGDAQTEQSQLPVSGTTFREIIAGLNGKDSNNSANGNGNNETLTFADGTPVPMMKDSKDRETADYSQMTAEQGAEWIKTRFGENADGFVDGRIKRAEKAVKAAEKIKVDLSGEEEDVAEALAARKTAIESAEKELNYFTAVKNVMKQVEAAEAAAGGEGATGNRYEQWRKDGYHIGEGGVRYDRQKKEDMTGVYGKDVKVDFTPTVGVNGRAKVVEVDSVQASHVNGQVNPMHFGPDWQPKDRTDDASKAGQDQALKNFDPEKITGDGNAFIGSSPSVNERHEAIQGNNRVEILRRLYDEQPEKAAQYKQWLIDHAEEYGLDAAEIAKMKKPILVNELPVDDAKALELGQYRASDFESGGKELPRTSVVINRLGDKMQNVANIMLRQGTLPEDAKMSDLVSQNATKVLDYLVKEGVVSATEEQTLRKDSTAMRQWMGELLKTGLFEGDKETEAAFNQLPDNARRAVLATYLRDAKSGDEAKIKRSLQRSFEAYSRMMNNPAFVNAKNVEEARAAVSAEIEKGNNSLFGEEPIRELFSNFELELAALYKGLKDQKTLTGLLNKYFDAVQGDKVSNRQLEIGEEPRDAISKEEALKEVFGLHESKPAETQNQVDKAVKNIATEITKKTGIEVVTDEKEAEEVIRESEETDSDLKYHKETDEATLEELENGAPEKGVKKSDQINEALKRGLQIDNSVKEFRTKDGEVYGFTDGKKIYLDTKKMKPETPLHEYAHLWCDMLRKVNPKEWENVKKLFDKVEGLKEEVKKLYPELEGDALYEEMITTYSGREGTKKLEDVVRKLAAEEGKSVTESAKAQGFLAKVKEALTKYWKGVADVLGIHFTTAEEVADKVLADWAKGVDPRESEEGKEKSEVSESKVEGNEPSEASLGLTEPGEQPGEKSEGAKPVGDGKEPKANPLDGMRKAAELFKDEQITKARAELAEAKKSGDASEVKRLTDKLKGLMDSTLRGKGIGLVERRKIIGEELGKAEAEKIDKPWADMEFDEQVAETEKKPLDADEIKNSDCDGVDKANAVAYLNGDKNIINTLSYLTVYDNVRNRERDSVPGSGTEDGTQLDAADNAGGEGLGRTDSRPQGVDSGQLGRTEGDGNPERGESVQSGERVSGGESGEVHPTAAVGEQGGEQVHGGASGVEPVSAGGVKSRGSRGVRGKGRDVRERGNEGSSNIGNEKAGEATGGRGIDSRNLSTVEQIDKEISDTQSLVDDLFNSLFDGRTKGSIISDRTNASIIPLASDHLLGKLGINKQKMAVYKQLIPALTKLGYLHIKKGVVKLNDWIDAMKGSFGGHLTKLGLSDEEVYDYIKNMWNSNIEVDGVTHKLSEWASILGTERMKKEIATPNAEKYKRQVAAEPIKVKIGDKKNIEETLPFLLPQQQEDVLKAETQFFGNEHADREHAYGKGYMFTNGTGTGKTFTGLGIAKRLVKQGKGRILIVTPSQKKVSDWIKDGHNLNMEIRDLDSWAKDRGTTATTESGEGVVITTFANFGVNKKLLETKWDAVIYDESHRIMENKNGAETARSMQHYMVTNRSENHCFLRLQETNKDYQKQKALGEQFDIVRAKETERIRKEYKASHPSATERDVAYATSRMVPRDVYNFTPSDYVTFPVLGKIHAEYVKALSHYINEVKPKLEAQAKNEWKDTKTIFLSATPFNTRENLDYVEGYIFKYPEGEKGGRISGRTQFYLDHFGAAYKFRYNRLEQSTSNPEAVAKQEIAFSDYLQDTLGTMSGRIIDSPYDYSRDFPTVSPDHAEQFNQAVQDAVRGHGVLADAYRRTIGDYNYGSALFETMKVANIIERIKAHLDAGRKVVIFHRRVETKEPLKPPFASMLEQANRSIALMKPGEEQKKAIQAVKDFRKKYADLLEWEQTLDYSMPREQIAKVFGKDKVLFFSGKESTKVKDKAVDTFNSDDSGKNIIVIQEASGKEGISLHDTTGKHQRVCITLALPQSPITALQIEGRTYRIGNKSNAIFEYPILGLNSEMMLFGEKFNNQVSTTENLALGSQARNLRDSFANGILEHSGVVPIDQQGVGGKEFDAPKEQSTDGFDNAVLDYYSNQKLNSRNREGVDYFPTPEPLGYKMMEWANMGEGDTVLEPSAGHGAIARYAPKGNQMVAIEPSQSLFTKLQLKAGGLGRKFQNTIFENYDISNKHDVVVMNPPFGTAGTTAIAHLGKAFKHLEEGGRVVALIPRGSTDKKFEKWIEGEKTAVMRAEVALPDIVFEKAGTKVVCRVVVVDKISNEAMRAKAGSVEKWDLGGHYDKIEDFFEDLRDVEMPDRIIDTNAIMMKKSKQTVKDLKELKDARVDFNEGGINVRVRGDWKDYSIPFDMEGYSPEQKKKFLASTYETFEQQERQTRNETSQAVLAELKKLTCKLAGMTEEEMQRYLKKKYEGKGVMYRIEHAAEVYGKANQHYRMKLGNTFSDSKEHFDAVRDRAVEEKGIVMPNLNKEKVKVVEVEKHSFKGENEGAIENARAWAKENLVTTNKQELPTMRDGTPYTISKKAVDKYLSSSAVSKSDELGIHLSVLPKLTDVIHESIEAEIHPDYKKGEDGMRNVENGYGEGVLVHRLYGAVELDGKTYRVKTTMQEFRGGEENKPHSYEVTKIELLDSPGKRENPDRPPLVSSNNSIDNKIELPDTPGTAVLPDSSPLDMTPSNSIDTANLLQGVEKSYDSGKKLLDESKDLTDGETLFRKEEDKSGYASLGLSKPTEPLADGASAHTVSERIGRAIDKAVEKTGGKVKMVKSVEEIGNEQVRRDIENGKQVTGWYDENTGEVHLYMPNIHDAYTAEKTVWHETVGHKGMRGLLGEKFNDYMRGLWMDLDNPVNAELRAYVNERMAKDSMGFYDAIEEFIAESAEKGKGEPGFWNNIKNKVTDALHEIGYRISPNVKDVKYMLWLAKNVQKKGDDPWWKMRADAVKWKIEHENVESVVEENGMMYDNNGKKHGLLDLNKKDFDEATDGHVHYRTSPMTASKIEEYNRRLSTKWYAFKESTVDDMQSLQEAMQIISGVKDAYTDIPSAFNPLQCHNRMGSMVMQMCERYDREYTEPLGDAFKKVVSAMPGKDGAEQMRNANLYFIKKHGLERNRVLFVRDWFRKMETTEGADAEGLDNLDKAWKGERSDLRRALDSGQIDLREYYRQMDEWIVQNIDKDFKAEEHDYSGMHGIYDVKKGEEYDDANVIDEVMSTESQLGADLVKSFWDAKKKATDFTIDQEYANGKKDRAERDHLKEMFDWYVPLRKFDDTVAEDVYGYISGGDTKNYIGSVIEKARGRESLSDVNVLAQISALAKSSIINGGKNVEKQHFMRFVEAYEKGDTKDRIFVEIQPWVEKHIVDGNEVWEEVMPNIPENSTQEQINDILNTFEETMKAKQAHGEAKIARRESDIGYKFERSSDMNQHIVNVYVNGRVRRFVCQGNPRAAQAINGLLRDSGTQNWATEKSAKLNRICAQLNTSLNPDFMSSNLMRDLTFASANLTKEGMGYTWDFCKEYAKNCGSMVRRKDGNFDGGYLGMFRRYKEGRLDANNQKERWFKEFMDNGGETGFVSLKKYEDIIKEYENLVKTGNKDGDRWLMKKLKEGGALVELANEVVENVARYSTYCVSRKRGRSIGKSIYDAKEVSSNFNRHGSGDAIKSLKTEYDGKTNATFRKSVGWFNSYMKNHTMFYNAGVQGANLFTKNIKHAPKTTAIAFGAMPFGLNIAVALLNQLLISQEDEKKRNGVKNPYAELPEWKRRNNLCIYWGDGKFKTIPMGIELRAFYGLGDIAAGYMVDESLKSDTPIGFDIIGQMAQLVPSSDFLGHHSPSSGIKELAEDVLLSATPTVAKPGLELAFNRNWTGRPIYRDKDYLDRAPRWKRAYDSTNDVYMTINKWANKTFNGIDDTNEDLKGSGMVADAADFFTAPYGLQHIVEGYTGGTGATIGRIYQTGKSLVKGVVSGIKDDKGFKEGFKKEWKNVDPNSIPFYRVFNYTPKEGNDMQRTKSKWYNYVNELEQLKYNKRQMKTNTSDVVMNIHNAATKYKFSKTKEGKMLKIYEAADKYISAKNKLLKRAKDQTVINSINEDINRKMQEAVADLDRISDD